jgi:hypothetical protein
MTKAPPDRCTSDEAKRLANAGKGRIRIAIDGVEQVGTVTEYCVSKGLARVHVMVDGKPQRGALGTTWAQRMVHGRIQVWWDGEPLPPGVTIGGDTGNPTTGVAKI